MERYFWASHEKWVAAMTADQFSRLEPGTHRLRCPDCGRGDRDRTMGVTVDRDRTVWRLLSLQPGRRTAARPDDIHARAKIRHRSAFSDGAPALGSPLAVAVGAISGPCMAQPPSTTYARAAARYLPLGAISDSRRRCGTQAATSDPRWSRSSRTRSPASR
jgi:hypothetical protein